MAGDGGSICIQDTRAEASTHTHTHTQGCRWVCFNEKERPARGRD